MTRKYDESVDAYQVCIYLPIYLSYSKRFANFNHYTPLCCCTALCCDILSSTVLCSTAPLCYAVLSYAILSYAMLCYSILCYFILCYAILCYAILYYAMLCHTMLCYAILCYAMHYYDMLCSTVLCLVTHLTLPDLTSPSQGPSAAALLGGTDGLTDSLVMGRKQAMER